MKRFLSVLLILAMALTTVAFAETATITPVVEEKELTNEEKLTKMLPVLDAMLRTLGIEGEIPYTAEDSALVWNLLVEIAKNERKTNPLILSDDTLMIVPKSVLLEYASASFFGMTELPEIPADPATVDLTNTIAYDAVTETYRIVLTAEDPALEAVKNETVIEHYGVEAEGDLLATVALYNVDEATQTETRVGALRVKMTVNPVPGTIQETALPLSVEEVGIRLQARLPDGGAGRRADRRADRRSDRDSCGGKRLQRDAAGRARRARQEASEPSEQAGL